MNGKYISGNENKKAGVAMLISDKIDLKVKAITKDKEGHFIIIKGSIQEDITLINIYAPNVGAPIGLSADFSTEIMQARREWQEIFKMMNIKNLQPKILYPAKLSLRIEGQIKSFTNKFKLKEFIIAKPELYKLLKGVL